jgi:transposase InsO family protein
VVTASTEAASATNLGQTVTRICARSSRSWPARNRAGATGGWLFCWSARARPATRNGCFGCTNKLGWACAGANANGWTETPPRCRCSSGPIRSGRWNFVNDALANGRGLRALTVVDNFTKEAPAIEVDCSLSAPRVTRVLGEIIEGRGTAPESIRINNGPEFTSRCFLTWAEQRGIRLVHIQPGKPTQNSFVESFNGRFRDECLNANYFENLVDAKRKIEARRVEYNEARPHSGLAYRTPAEFARQGSLPPQPPS